MAEKIKKVNPKKDDLYQVLSNDLKTMKDDLVTEVKVSAAQVASMYKGVKDASASSASALAQEVRYGYKQNQNIYEGIATLVKAEVAAKISVIADKMEKLEVESVLKEIKDLKYGYMQLQAVYQALTDLVSEGVIEPVKVLEEKTAMLDSMQAPLQDISAKLAAGAGVSEEAVRKIVADSIGSVAGEIRELKYGSMQSQSMYHALSNLVSERVIAPLNTLISKNTEMDNVPASVRAINEKLAAGIGISEETVKQIVEESLSAHSKEVLEAITQATKESVVDINYEKIAGDTAAKVVESIAAPESINYEKIIGDTAGKVLENIAKPEAIDYDKIVGATAAKVVESMPTPEAIDYSRIEEVVTELDELKYSYMQLQSIYQELTKLISDKVASPVDAIQTSLHELHEKVGASLSEETVKRIVDESVAPLAANVGASEEVVKKIVEDSLSAHCKSVFDSLATQPVIEAIDYDRIANQLNDKANELLEKSTPIDYDKIVSDTAAKVVESLPYPTTIDYSRINEMIVAAVSSAVNVDTIADAVAAKLSISTPTVEALAVKDMPEVVAEEVSAATVEAVDVDAIADAVVAKIVLPEIEPVDVDAIADAVIAKIALPETEPVDVDAIADAVIAKIVLPETEPVDVDAIADAVADKLPDSAKEGFDVSTIAEALSLRLAIPSKDSVDVNSIADAVSSKIAAPAAEPIDVESIAEALAVKLSASASEPTDVAAIAEAVAVKLAVPANDPVDVDSIANAVASKIVIPTIEVESKELVVDYDKLADLVVEKLAQKGISADVILDKEGVDKIAETVAEKIGPVDNIDYDKVCLAAQAAQIIPDPVDYDRVAEIVEDKVNKSCDAIERVVVLDEEGVQKIVDGVADELRNMTLVCEYEEIAEEPATEEVVEEATEELATEEVVEEATEESATEEVVEEATEEVVEVVEEPATEEVVEEATEEPATEEVVEATEAPAVVEFVVDEAVEEMAATSDSPAYEESLDGELIDAETGLVLRLKRSFIAKMKQSEDKVKAYYSDLKNELTSYKRINSNVSWHGDRFNFGRDTVAKIGINGKTLCFYLALDPNDPELKQTVYHQKDVGAQKAYESTPFMVKVKSDAALKKALRLAAILAEKLATEKDEKFEAVDYVVEFTYESTKALFEAGYIKATKEKKVDFNF